MSWPSNGMSSGSSRLSAAAAALAAPSEKPLRKTNKSKDKPELEASKISAYARLDFENYTFFVQTLQVVLGRKSTNEGLSVAQHSVDVHLSSGKAISRRHAKIFYNFGTQRFEISVLGRNGAFVRNQFVAKGLTVPLTDSTKIQIGDIPFTFVLPSIEPAEDKKNGVPQFFNPSDALNLRSNLYTSPRKNSRVAGSGNATPDASEGLSISAKEDENRKLGTRELKADLFRRLSIARRKSLSSASADEINALISELEADPLSDSAELDDDIRVLLHNSRHLSKEELEKEEDEIDRLVSQHNLQEGVFLDDSSLEKGDLADDLPAGLDVNVLDQEIASLAPLLDSSSDKGAKVPRIEASMFSHDDKCTSRPQGLIRMGKAATIQPPSNKHYVQKLTSPTYAGYSPDYTGVGGSAGHPSFPAYTYQQIPVQRLQVVVEPIHTVNVPQPAVPFRAITVDAESLEHSPICVLKTLAPIRTPKLPLRRREQASRKPKMQSIKEVPEQFKTKPATSISAMVGMVLKHKKLTLAEIIDDIKESFPYYKYCPDGWQFSVTHIVKFNKMFCAVHQPEIEADWVWTIDSGYLEEKEKIQKRQHDVAMAKAKDAALRLTEFRSRQQSMYPNQYMQSTPPSIYPSSTAYSPSSGSRSSLSSSSHYGRTHEATGFGRHVSAKPRSIGVITSEIERDHMKETPSSLHKLEHSGERDDRSIKAQLAANRAKPLADGGAKGSPAPAFAARSADNTAQHAHIAGPASTPKMNNDTKKSLTYLQKELFTLYKARNLSYNTAAITEVITKALATTIAQVNIIGAKAGCGDNALTFLVEKAPQQVSKILDIALTKSIKEKQASQAEGGKGISANLSITGDGADKQPEARPESKTPAMTDLSGKAEPEPVKQSFAAGLSRPAFAGLSKAHNSNKPGALAKPPQFLSNKPSLLGEHQSEKRGSEDDNLPKKVMKISEQK